ncbi:MAG: FCD domain-containing protein, partial [Microvirga sp.]
DITPAELLEVEYQARRCVDAEAAGLWKEALVANQEFHFQIYRASRSTILVRMIENLWLLTGPYVNYVYPSTPRPYRSAEPHSRIVEALRRGDAAETGEAVVYDTMKGSTALVELLRARAASEPKRRTMRVR